MPNVASFQVDHRLMVAPFIRLSKSMAIPSETHEVLVFDIRLRTPNEGEPISPKAIHSLEHLWAGEIRDVFETVNRDILIIDISPMGCRTGFYLSLVAPQNRVTETAADLAKVLKASCEHILKYKEVPAANPIQCGSGVEHDLFGAQAVCAYLLQTMPLLPFQPNEPLLLNPSQEGAAAL